MFADAAYDRLKLMDKASYLNFVIEVIRRSESQKDFEVQLGAGSTSPTPSFSSPWAAISYDEAPTHKFPNEL